jgi:hypothetical protein
MRRCQLLQAVGLPVVNGARALTAGAVALAATFALAVGSPVASAFRSRIANFTSPSGNIGCNIIVGLPEGGNGARCDIKVHTFKIPKPHPACRLAFGDSLEVGTSGKAGPVCHGDTVFEPGERKLAYGKSETLGRFTCTSATSGMTCKNTKTRHGFFISRAKYRLF